MANKSVSFFQENLADMVVSINNQNYGGTIPVANFPNQYPFTWLQSDPDGVTDLCTNIPEQTQSIEGTFKRSDNTTYQLQSVDFIGNHPKPRPH